MQTRIIKHLEQKLVMAGQQREFVVIVEDRRACGGAVIGKAKPLRELFVDARQP